AQTRYCKSIIAHDLNCSHFRRDKLIKGCDLSLNPSLIPLMAIPLYEMIEMLLEKPNFANPLLKLCYL
ncbi:MAG: hypothetical protein RLP02_28675, partial [Coleofasciculus sp. C2-GNP5-27]